MLRRSGLIPKRRPGRILAASVAVATAAALISAGPADAEPPASSSAGTPYEHSEHHHRDIDNRRGTLAPTGRQAAAARRLGTVRWNALGTPAAVGPNKAAGTGLATTLAADPDAAARQYLIANQDLYGLDATAVAAMDTLLVRGIGAGTVVLLRQRFGEPAGRARRPGGDPARRRRCRAGHVLAVARHVRTRTGDPQRVRRGGRRAAPTRGSPPTRSARPTSARWPCPRPRTDHGPRTR